MSKDLAIAGIIVLSCLAVTAIAFVSPAKTDKDAPSVSMTDTIQQRPSPVIEPSQPPAPPSAENAHASGFEDLASLDPLNTTEAPLVAQGGNEFSRPPSVFTPTQMPIANPPRQAQPAPPDVPVPPPADPAQPRVHVVAAGEMLGDISLKYYGTTRYWKNIRDANKVDPDALKIGQKLEIPVIDKVAAALPATATGAAPALEEGQRLYTVKEGDSFYMIAQRELGNPTRFKEIEKLNAGSEDLRPGQVIKLPGSKSQAATAVAPVAAAPVDAPAPAGTKIHVVTADDTLSDLSIKYFGTSTRWRDIQQANPGIDPNSLKVGQKIVIPDQKDAAPTAPAAAQQYSAPAPAASADIEYTVRSGDNLQSIAQHFYGNGNEWKRIHSANPGVDPKVLRVGQKLKIVGATAPADVVKTPANTEVPSQVPAPGTLGRSPFAPPSAQDPVYQPTAPVAPMSGTAPFTPPAEQQAPAPAQSAPSTNNSNSNSDEVFKDFFPK